MNQTETSDDVAWWWDLAHTLRWTWATTYADSAPHWYVVAGRTPGFTAEDAQRVANLVRTQGEPGKFHAFTNLYLFNPERTHKIWCMFSEPAGDGSDVRIVNLARTDRSYGPQRDFDEDRLRDLRNRRAHGQD